MGESKVQKRQGGLGGEVISLRTWARQHAGRAHHGAAQVPVARFKMLSKAQKQATLLKYIMSDEIGDAELDSLATAIEGIERIGTSEN